METLLARLGVGFFLTMLAATLLGVVARYCGVAGFEWSFEIAGLTFVWVTFLGVAVAERREENVAFGSLKAMARPRLRHVLEVLASVCLLAMGLALLASGAAVLQRAALVPSPVLRWPTGLIAASVAVCGVLIGGIAACRLRRQIFRPRPVP